MPKNSKLIKRFDRFLLKSYIGPFILTFAVGDFILLMQFFWKYFDELVGKGIEWNILMKMTFYAATTFVPMALPIGILLSSLICFGNMGERYELVAIKATGVSLRRVLAPLIMLVSLIACMSMYFSNYILPKTNLKFQAVFHDIRRQKLAFNIVEGVFYDGLDGYMIRVNKKEDDDKTLRDVMIYTYGNTGSNNVVTCAEWGTMELYEPTNTLILTLYNGFSYDDSYKREKADDKPFRRLEFERDVMRFDMSQFDMSESDEGVYSSNYKNLNANKLVDKIAFFDSTCLAKENDFVNFSSDRFNFYASNVKPAAVPDTADFSFVKRPILSNLNDSINRNPLVTAAVNKAKNDQQSAKMKSNVCEYNESMLIKHKVENYNRYVLAIGCIVLFLVGAPLGAIIRKGGLGMPLVLAVFIFIIYYIILTSGQKAAIQGSMSPFVGMWLANIIVLPVGLFLTAKATSDSPVLDPDYWNKLYNTVKKIFGK